MSCVTVNPISQLSAGPVALPMVSQSTLTSHRAVIAARYRLNTPALALASAQGRKRSQSSLPASTFLTATMSPSRVPVALVADTCINTTAATTPRSAMASGSKSARCGKRSVRFAPGVDYAYTYSPDEYDRSAQPMAQLSFRDFAEMLQVRAMLRRQTEEAIQDAAKGRIAKGNLPAMQALRAVQI